jgi:P-type Cu+ transporter
VLPDQKAVVVERLCHAGRVTAMAGDGVNDALAVADVGVATGTGADMAMENAGITLLRGDLRGIVRARHLAHHHAQRPAEFVLRLFLQRRRRADRGRVLYPWFGLLLSPMIGALAISLSSVSVITNALRLRWVRLGP